MSRELTPAVTRLLASLASNGSDGECQAPLPARLLLGLLSESECRAALTLGHHSVSEDDVIARWPELAEIASSASSASSRPASDPLPFDYDSEIGPQELIQSDSELLLTLGRAGELLADFPQPLAMATEHVLLGLVAGEGEVSSWLRERGLQTDQLLQELRAQFGIDNTPLEVELPDDETSPSTSEESKPRKPQPLPEEFDDNIAAFLAEKNSQEPARQTATEVTVATQQAVGQGSAPSESAAYRVVDAAANRACEGLRVLEDIARFVLNDQSLTRELKTMRHAVAAQSARFPADHLVAARDVPGDVGTSLTTTSEQQRESTTALLTANFRRVQESLRSLEEFCKLIDPQVAATFKQLRYACYSLQRSVMLTHSAVDVLAKARLYVLVNGGTSNQAFEILSKSLIDAGVPLLQLRDKQLDDRQLLERASALVNYAAGTDTRVIINDRPDVAAAVSAAGVHLGQEELATSVARKILPPRRLIGVSTHALPQARQAVADGADYLGVGPTFPSTTKQFEEFPGLEYAQAVAAEISLPAYAIGGVTLANLEQVMATGIHGVAVGAAVTEVSDPPATAKGFLRVLG